MIGVDLGTTNVRIHVKGRGILLREPAVIAIVQATGETKAVGLEAYRMLERTPNAIVAVRPMADGVIADYSLTEKMLKAFIRRVLSGPSRFFKADIMVCVPSGITEVERRAVVQAVNEIGARRVMLIQEPLAAALGAGINIVDPIGSMVVDIGGGTTDIAVMSLGGIVVNDSLRIAGNHFDEDIVRYVRHQHNLLIGKRTAEELKQRIGAAVLEKPAVSLTSSPETDLRVCDVRGRDAITGLPRTVVVRREEVYEALSESLEKIAQGLRRVLEWSPPELISDVMERGIVLTGGGAMLRHMDVFLSRIADVPVLVADNPSDCVVLGTSQALTMPRDIQEGFAMHNLQRY